MKIWLKKAVKTLAKKIDGKNSNPLVTISISKSSLLHNLTEFQKIKPENKIAPVLKSNAYGHGVLDVAHVLENKAEFFVIDSDFEARKIRGDGIKTPLLIIGYVRPETMNASKLKKISYTISSLDALHSITKPTNIHLKIDTGMHRQGILPEELEQAFSFIKNNKHITLEGICSHLSDADMPDTAFTEQQIKIWNALVEKTKKEFPSLKYIHLSNSPGHVFLDKINSNASRLGIGLYGLIDIEGLDLKPVLEMETILTGVKKIKKGETVGYNNTFTASRDILIATVPLGYYEGLDRRLSNKGWMKVKGVEVPIIGRVSMNITTLDVSSIKDVKIGDKVQVISPMKSDKNSLKSIAQTCQTITYEMVVRIPGEIKRTISLN